MVRFVAGLLLIAVAGCSTARPPPVPARPAGKPAPMAPPAATRPAMQHTTLTTRLNTRLATQAAGGLFDVLGWQTFGEADDIFLAVVHTTTAEGREVTVKAVWRASDVTDVSVDSTLTPEQHAYVVGRLRDRLANSGG